MGIVNSPEQIFCHFQIILHQHYLFLSTRSRKQFSRRLRKHSRRDPIKPISTGKYLSSYCNAVGYELLDSANRRLGDGSYTYNADKRVQTDPPTQSWMNDYESPSPVTGGVVRTEPTSQLVLP